MSNSLFSITIAAKEVLDEVPRGLRSKFVSDAILHYAKKKNILNEYLTSRPEHKSKSKKINSKNVQLDSTNSSESSIIKNEETKPKKVNVDSGY